MNSPAKSRIDAQATERLGDTRRQRGELRDALKAGSYEKVQDETVRVAARLNLLGKNELLEHIGDTDGRILERIIKANELKPVHFVFELARLARSVGRISIVSSQGRGYGTGFLISNQLIMTNNHVLSTKAIARQSSIQFDYYTLPDGQMARSTIRRFDPSQFFITSSNLDYTIVALAEPIDRSWIPLIRESGKAVKGERVNVVQHPEGRPMQVSLRQNTVLAVHTNYLHYESDTMRGSSGSPVLNEQLQLAALHHAGVPERSADGTVTWIANEGVRISKIVDDAQRQLHGGHPLLNAAFNAPPPDEQATGEETTSGGFSVHTEGGRTTIRIPLEVTYGVALPQAQAAAQPLMSAMPTPPPPPVIEDDIAQLIEDYSTRAYYDAAADRTARESYYQDFTPPRSKDSFFTELGRLVSTTHRDKIPYNQARRRYLYPWVDLHEEADGDRVLQSIYSGKPFSIEEIFEMDAAIEMERHELLMEAMNSGDEQDLLDALERQYPYNCEHVVPQSWFQKREPMKGDLHHLFTCEWGCNSFRSNFAYTEFSDEAVRADCGRSENGKFEPKVGKGPVARATLYFLLRYPGLIGDADREMKKAALPVVLDWHQKHPVTIYELHRNAAIAEIQGNRNPFIDHPEWVEKVNFKLGFTD